jgi:hypothetical protein
MSGRNSTEAPLPLKPDFGQDLHQSIREAFREPTFTEGDVSVRVPQHVEKLFRGDYPLIFLHC